MFKFDRLKPHGSLREVCFTQMLNGVSQGRQARRPKEATAHAEERANDTANPPLPILILHGRGFRSDNNLCGFFADFLRILSTPSRNRYVV